MTYSFQYHADQDPEKVKAFWALLLGVDPALFTYQRKSNSGQLKGRVWRSEFGVLSVGTSDTDLRSRLEAWMDCVKEEWS